MKTNLNIMYKVIFKVLLIVFMKNFANLPL